MSEPKMMILIALGDSGIADGGQTTLFGHLLRSLCADGHLGILLVEHDIELVSDVCDRVYVLDFGRLIFEGSVDEALTSEVMRAAYLGSATAST